MSSRKPLRNRDVLSMFIAAKSEFTIPYEEMTPSGRPLLPGDVAERLKARRTLVIAASVTSEPDGSGGSIAQSSTEHFIHEQPTKDGEMASTRKRGRDSTDDFLPIFSAKDPRSTHPPWARGPYMSSHATLNLHCEILDFYNWLKPSDEEMALRRYAVDDVKTLLQEHAPSIPLYLCGSMETDLLHPLSDINMVVYILNKQSQITFCEAVYKDLTQKEIGKNVFLARANMDFIAFQHKSTGLWIRVSVKLGATPPPAPQPFDTFLEEHPAARPLILLLKYFLLHRCIMKPRGAMPSDVINVMVAAFLQHCQRGQQTIKHPGLGQLFVQLLHFYGMDFNFANFALSVHEGGSFCSKWEGVGERGDPEKALVVWDFAGRFHVIPDVLPLKKALKTAFRLLSIGCRLQAPCGGEKRHAEHPCVDYRSTLLSRIIYVDSGIDLERRRVKALAHDLGLAATPTSPGPP